jgi:hypothetical protein
MTEDRAAERDRKSDSGESRLESDRAIFLPEQSADSAAIPRGLKSADKFAKARREKLASYLPVASNSWRGDIMSQKFLPAAPELFVHQTVEIVKVNRLERLEKLVGGVKKTSLILRRERSKVLQASPPDARHVGIFHKGVGHIPDRRGGGVLSGHPRDASAPVHLYAEIEHRQNDRN